MFTGIISDIGTISSTQQNGDLRVVVAVGFAIDTVAIGASIACSGACLTVVNKGYDQGNWVAVDVSRETLARTVPGMWQEGQRLNLERPLKLGDELGGHIVTGHVDGIGSILSVEPSGDSLNLVLSAPSAIAPYLAAKGSIAIDGVSLTINTIADQEPANTQRNGNNQGDGDSSAHFTVTIIPHTQALTTFDRLAPGALGLSAPGTDAPRQQVNLEIDIMARYLRRMMTRFESDSPR